MMDDQERSMHASDGGADVGADTDETYARAALGAHPWPRFGEALKARLMAIPTTEPQASSGASPESRRTPTHDTGPLSVPRDARRRRREAWAMAVVLAVVAGLAIALAGTARVRQGRPVGMGPSSYPATAITDVLKGRLIYARNDRDDGRFTMYALHMRDGTTERLFDGPVITATDTLWSVSPDGSRIAFARTEGMEDAGGVIYIGALTKDAPEPEAVAAPQMLAGIQWATDSRSIYYGLPTYHDQPSDPESDTDPILATFEVHHLTVGGATDAPIGGGEDRVIYRLGQGDLDSIGLAELIGVDEASHHMAVSTAVQDANGFSGEILLIDLNDGSMFQRIATNGMAIGINHTLTPSRAAVSFLWCTTCEDRDPQEVRRVDLATGRVDTLVHVGATDFHTPVIWSPDERWIVAQGWMESDLIHAVDLAQDPAREMRVDGSYGRAGLFAPGTAVLLTSAGQLVDLAAVATGESGTMTTPWPLPDGFRWDDGPIFAWLPEDPDAPYVPAASADASVSNDETPVKAITPVARVETAPNPHDPNAAPLLDIGEWSPDSRWLPFWTAEHDDWMNPSDEAARLYFYDATTGSTCAQPGVQRRSRSDTVGWADDGQAIVRVDAVPAVGAPCRSLVPAPDSPLALPTTQAGETPSWAYVWSGDGPVDTAGDESTGTSPDGSYIVTTRTLDDTPRYRTSISRAADGSLTGEAQWTGSGGFGGAGIGGTWMPDDGFLIQSSVDKGPMIIEPNGDVTNVATDLFYMPATAGDVGNRIAWLLASPDGPDGHLFLTGVGGVQLYHPEIHVPEALPSEQLWGSGVSRDGRWLTLHGREGESGPPKGLWIRGIEDSGEPFRLIPESQHNDMRVAPVSTSGQRIAFGDYEAGTFAVVTFPEGVVVGRWRLDGHRFGSAHWSPDGRTVAIHGYQYDSNSTMIGRALFIVPLPPEP